MKFLFVVIVVKTLIKLIIELRQTKTKDIEIDEMNRTAVWDPATFHLR